MADEILRSRHAFGSLQGVYDAISAGLIDQYDILFLDGDTVPKVGWVDKDGNVRIVDTECVIVVEEESLPEVGKVGKLYIFEENGYIWTGTEFKSLSANVDLSALETEIAKKLDAEEADAKFEKIKYEISHKPSYTLVDYRDKEIRIMCPADTEFVLQESGEGSEANKYYIGFKAYAPSDDVVSFKEDLAEIIADGTMYYFEDNAFAGVDSYGRKYSIVWLPVAVCDESGVWTYYGAESSTEKYIGWYYSVEWYGTDGKVLASDCIRINLSNEECHSSIEPFYISHANAEVDAKIEESVNESKTYTDEQIALAIAEACAVIEF